MDASHVIELVIFALAAIGGVTAIGALFTLGRRSSYDD